jgi:drug/metabolite transporter (DMT)-like permease
MIFLSIEILETGKNRNISAPAAEALCPSTWGVAKRSRGVVCFAIVRSDGVFMNSVPPRSALDLRAVTLLILLCALWGLNAVAIKVSNQGIAPIFAAGLRSVIATMGLVFWMKAKHLPLFPASVGDGLVIGLMFGTEFGLLYSSLVYTSVSSAWILLYTTPFFHALGAHYLLADDRMSPSKWAGLVLAFVGIVLLLSKDVALPSPWQLMGDLLAIGAAILWAVTTIYIKRRLVGRVSSEHTLLYQTLFSIPLLFVLSYSFGEEPATRLNGWILISIAYQGVIIAFLSYLLWFSLVHSYPVSRLSSFTFLTPIFAVFAGVLLLGEPLSVRAMVSLALVSTGIYAVNRP